MSDCPHGDGLHDDDDGCPSCIMAELMEWYVAHVDDGHAELPCDGCPYCAVAEEEPA